MRRQLLSALGMIVIMTVVLGLAYPLAVYGVSQGLFKDKANGSLVKVNGRIVGSRLLGQQFTKPQYFLPRPSAAGDGYDALASSASNLGPSNDKLLASVEQRVAAYRTLNGLGATDLVPVDAVTSSGSGLDPDISIANARLQAPRVARERNISVPAVLALISKHTSDRQLGVLGEKAVNVLALNLDLDRAP